MNMRLHHICESHLHSICWLIRCQHYVRLVAGRLELSCRQNYTYYLMGQGIKTFIYNNGLRGQTYTEFYSTVTWTRKGLESLLETYWNGVVDPFYSVISVGHGALLLLFHCLIPLMTVSSWRGNGSMFPPVYCAVVSWSCWRIQELYTHLLHIMS